MIVGAAVERETVDVRPSDGTGSLSANGAGHGRLNAVQGGAGLRGGYDWQYFGVQLGMQAWSAWGDYTDRKLTSFLLPQAELRGGAQHHLWFSAGFGSPLVTTYRRPGAYLGAGLKLDLHEFNAFLGSYRAGPAGFDDGTTRFDLVWKFPAFHGWGPRLGGSLSDPHESSAIDWEASLGVAALL